MLHHDGLQGYRWTNDICVFVQISHMDVSCCHHIAGETMSISAMSKIADALGADICSRMSTGRSSSHTTVQYSRAVLTSSCCNAGHFPPRPCSPSDGLSSPHHHEGVEVTQESMGSCGSEA